MSGTNIEHMRYKYDREYVKVCIINAVEGILCGGLCAVVSSQLCRIRRKKCNVEARAAESLAPRDLAAVCCFEDARDPCSSSRTVQKPNEAIVHRCHCELATSRVKHQRYTYYYEYA